MAQVPEAAQIHQIIVGIQLRRVFRVDWWKIGKEKCHFRSTRQDHQKYWPHQGTASETCTTGQRTRSKFIFPVLPTCTKTKSILKSRVTLHSVGNTIFLEKFFWKYGFILLRSGFSAFTLCKLQNCRLWRQWSRIQHWMYY